VNTTFDRRRRGRLLVISAPSGAGKTTLVRGLLEREPRIKFSISYTTRPKRTAEVEGSDYFFVDEREFLRMVETHEFLEHAHVFDHWYGTGLRHVERLLDEGLSVLLEIDWQGAAQVRSRMPDATSVFLLPPGVGELERRLRGRATDSEETIRRRLRDALSDMEHWNEFDYVIVNADAAVALDQLAAIAAGRGEAYRSALPAVTERARSILAEAHAATSR
jgi:guanylate kinase